MRDLPGALILGFVCSVFAPGGHAAPAADPLAACDEFKLDPKASDALSDAPSAPAQGACKVRHEHGLVLPDRNCTPGAINPTLTAKVLRNPEFRTGCVRGHATTDGQKAGTYATYAIPHPAHNVGVMQTCELDHLISLELGGADTIDNIWPQCGPQDVVLVERDFKQKDMVENYLARQVRDGLMDLSEVQHGIAEDWTQYLDEARKTCASGSCK